MANVLRLFVPKLCTSVEGAGLWRKHADRNTRQVLRVLGNFARWQCTNITAGERRIAEKIKSKLNVSNIEVEDISGGCGSMYRIAVTSSEFKGKRTIQQHKIITNILEDEVRDMHGLTIETSVS